MPKFNSCVQEADLAITHLMCEFNCLMQLIEVLNEFVQ